MMATLIRHPAFTPPMPAVTRILAQFDREQIEGFIEIAIGLLDIADGDPDAEEDNQDCCVACDDTGGKHVWNGYGNHLPGDPDDAEDVGDAEPDHFDTPPIDYAFDQRIILPNRVFGNSGFHVDNDAI